MKHRHIIVALLATLSVGVGACGDDAPGESAARSSEPVVVSAAASLQTAFTTYGETFDGGRARFSFAGSDALAAQIRQGVRPDVFAAANTALPEELHTAGLVDTPVVFAGNRLVLAVPAAQDSGSSVVRSLADLQRAGTSIAVGSAGVPVGAYTRKVLGRLPAADRRGILANVRSEEPDVKGIVGKLTQGAVDAGFVYVTDVAASKGRLRAIELPEALRPSAAYGVAVVKGAEHPEAARAFVEGLLEGDGRRALDAAGFEPPPQ